MSPLPLVENDKCKSCHLCPRQQFQQTFLNLVFPVWLLDQILNISPSDNLIKSYFLQFCKQRIKLTLIQAHQGHVEKSFIFIFIYFWIAVNQNPSGQFSCGKLKKCSWLLVGSDFSTSGTRGPFFNRLTTEVLLKSGYILRRGFVKSSSSETLVSYSMWSESLMVSSVVWMH